MLNMSEESAAEDTPNEDSDLGGMEEEEEEMTDTGISDTIDEIVEGVEKDTVNATKTSNTGDSQKPMSEIMETKSNENAPLGIGGKGGFTYDVNRVKKNLVQESVRQFKHEILSLLQDDTTYMSAKTARVMDRSTGKNVRILRERQSRDEAIEDKIASLVAANPVSTTTDSNLLDGEWRFAYSSNNVEGILMHSRFVFSQTKTARNRNRKERGLEVQNEGNISNRHDGTLDLASSKRWNLRVGKIKNPFQTRDRTIYLENLRPEEYPYMLDTTSYLNGIFSVQRRYDVVGLTRTSLEVNPNTRYIKIGGAQVSNTEKESESHPPIEIQNIYLDSDLCISLLGGEEKTLNLFTKSENFRVKKTKLQLLRITISWLSSFESPLHFRSKLRAALGREKSIEKDTLSDEEYDIMLRRVYADNESKLTALRIGVVGDLSDEPVWDGEEDPFVHMSSLERQEYMKKLSIEEIKKAGYGQKLLVQKKKRKVYRKQKKFNKPKKLE